MSGMMKFLKSLVELGPPKSAAQIPEVASVVSSLSSNPSSTIQSVKPHVPLIKFRKGGHAASASHPSSGASGGASSGRGSGHTGSSRATIEDYQLPARYRRQPMDQKEIDYINRGGPE